MVFNVYYQNVRGLRTKTVQFKRNIQQNNYDVVVLTETWLLDGILSEELFSDVYCVWRRDREYEQLGQARGGGVLIAVRRELTTQARPHWHSTAEDLWVTITFKTRRNEPPLNLHLGTVYMCAQNQGLSFSSQLSSFCEKVLRISTDNPDDKILIMGDFNMSDISWSSSPDCTFMTPSYNKNNGDHAELIDLLHLTNLNQYNYVFNQENRILDLILCNNDVSIFRCLDPMTREDTIYHPTLVCRPLFINYSDLASCPRKFYFYARGDYQSMSSELSVQDWISLFSCVSLDEAVEQFINILCRLRDKYVPFKYVRPSTYPVWYSSALVKILKEKNKHHKKLKLYNNKHDSNSFIILRERAKRVEHECYLNYISMIENSIRADPNTFWSYIKSNKKHNSYPSTMKYVDSNITTGVDICNAFANFFNSNYLETANYSARPPVDSNLVSSADICTIEINNSRVLNLLKTLDCKKSAGPDDIHPCLLKNCAEYVVQPIALLFKRSIDEGVVPKVWKTVTITPIHKKGSKNDVTNYRPISKLCALAKIFEKIIHDQLYSTLKHSFIPQQHGFLRGRSTTTNLVEFIDTVTAGMDSGGQVDAVYTDYSKAFDRIDHNILLDKLQSAGIRGDLLRWFASYVKDRCQTVVLGGYASAPSPIPSGVPQGSILGPLLFTIFINDIYACFKNSNFLLFADDMKIFKVIKNIRDQFMLQRDLDRLHDYCILNNLDLNVTKCCYITFSRSNKMLNFDYNISGQSLMRADTVVDLGITLDSKLLFDKHIDNITAKAMKLLGFLFRVTKDFKTLKTLKILYCSLVRSQLEYASQVWNPMYDKYIDMLEKPQKKFLRFINYKYKIKTFDYIDSCRRQNILPLSERREAADLTFLHNIFLNVLDSPTLLSEIKLLVPFRSVSRRNYLQIYTPPYNSNYRRNSFLPRTIVVFNTKYSKYVDFFSMKRNSFKHLANEYFFG